MSSRIRCCPKSTARKTFWRSTRPSGDWCSCRAISSRARTRPRRKSIPCANSAAESLIDVVREKQRIAQSKMLAPMAGLVAVRQNRATDFYFPGMQLPDIHEGDTLRPGIPVADILDLSELEVLARVGELDRANLHEGQEVSITLDAVPDQKFRGTIKTMSGMASSAVFSGDPAKKFDVVFRDRHEATDDRAGSEARTDPRR